MSNEEIIVKDLQELANDLKFACHEWLHTSTDRRRESAGQELSEKADLLYTFINNNTKIMGSDSGRPAFDEPDNPDFQEDMNGLWDQPEPDFREIKRLKHE